MSTRRVVSLTERGGGSRSCVRYVVVSPDRLPPFALLLRDLRRSAGLTQSELAVSAGLGVRTLRDLERGRAGRPQRSTVELLANALKLDGAQRDAFVANARARRFAHRVGLRPRPTLIGRDDALNEIANALDLAGLVSLVGLAGVGKTVLALAVCHHLAGRFSGGVGGVAVTEASTESEILTSVASALGVARVGDALALLRAGPVLILLDGVDRSPSAAIGALARLREAASGHMLSVVATSRHPLGVPDEIEWPVPPLVLPPVSASGREVFGYPATQLFLDRLRLVRARPVAVSEAITLGELVRRLGGVPLALELAAMRGRVLELDEMLARCADSAAATDPAGTSLRAAVEATWRLLAPAEQASLSRLAIFQWRWSMTLAEDLLGPVTDAPEQGGAADVVGLVDRLVGVGLVNVWPEAHELRFWLIEAVRDVARERAELAGLLEDAKDRHAAAIVGVVRQATAELTGPRASLATERMDFLAADAQAALRHLSGRDPERARCLDDHLTRWRQLRGG